MVLKQKVIDLVGKYKAEDIVEHETTHLPGGYVTVTIKFKKTCGVILSEEDKREFREKREKASNSGKGKDDKSLSLDKGKGKGLVLTAEFLEGYLKMRQEGDKSEGKDDKSLSLDKSKSKSEPELFDIATPKLEIANVTIYVITLLDTYESMKRLGQINYLHEKFKAFSHTSSEPDIIQVLGRAQEHTGTAPRQRACFFSHFKLWQKIAVGNLNTIICEDDALLVRDIDLPTFSDDCITLLGGCIRTPGAWCREKSEFVENLKFLNIVKNFKPGLNIIDYDKFRWTNCLAYYLPVNIARKLVNKVEADKHKVRPVDIWLGQTGFVQQLFFPNIFIDMDDSVTQVNSPKGHQKADFYICEFMRKEAMKQDIRLSMRGSSSLLGEP